MSPRAGSGHWPVPAAEPCHLGMGEVHVWRGRISELAAHAPRLERLLSDEERRRAGDALHAHGDDRFVFSRGVLRVLLGAYLGVDAIELKLRHQGHGKPELDAPFDASGLHFNVSHSGDCLLWAMSRGHALGVDVERERPVERQAGIVQQFFSPAEQQALCAVPAPLQQRRFFELWTCKEAWAKAVGLGVFAGMGHAEVRLSPNGRAHLAHAPGRTPALPLSLRRLDVAPGYAAALAVHGSTVSPRLWTLDGDALERLLPHPAVSSPWPASPLSSPSSPPAQARSGVPA